MFVHASATNSRSSAKVSQMVDNGRTSRVPTSVTGVLAMSGRPLDASLHGRVPSFRGVDLSSVRIHADEAAATSARDVGAEAYTVGNHIVFGSGAYAPHTSAGQRLLAHELTHVAQQGGRSAPFASYVGEAESPAEREAERVAGESYATVTHVASPGSVLQRQKKAPEAGDEPADPGGEVLAQVAAIEANWQLLSQVSRPYPLLKPWLLHGDTVVALIRLHATSALAARRAGNVVLAAAYTEAAATDKITYDYVAWHVTSYVNLLSIQAAVDRLVAAFDHDNRAFTGRRDAERITRQLQTAISGLSSHSAEALALIRTDIPLVVRAPAAPAISIAVTSPAIDPKVAALFRQSTAGMQQLQANVQNGAQLISQFVDEAFVEGLDQAAEALEEYYQVREILGGPKGGKKKETDLQPRPVPLPLERPPTEDGGKQPSTMRFQVQWNSRAKDPKKKGQFAEVASAPSTVGVTAAQAVTALLATHAKVPGRARSNAEPAVEAQIKWINSRPANGGIATAGYSKSEPFPYDYPDARVDVENLRGHNLRR